MDASQVLLRASGRGRQASTLTCSDEAQREANKHTLLPWATHL